MGLSCKPIGKEKSFYAKLKAKEEKEKMAIKAVKKIIKEEKEN